MKNSKILAIVVLAFALMVCPVSKALGAISLTVNGEALDAITLKTGQVCTVEVVSDNSDIYKAYVGFDDRIVLGSFDQPLVMPEAGDGATIIEYDEPSFYGYFVLAGGSLSLPSPGIHFTIKYRPNQVGETELKLYDSLLDPAIDVVHITVVDGRIGTAFTYQGRLLEDGNPADGLHDFQFSLYNDANTIIGNQLGNTIDINDVDVIDGYFSVELDFGSDVFDGYTRWLEIGVRPGVLSDPCEYTILGPRQKITPTPYALQTRGIFVDNTQNVGIGTTSPTGKLHVDGGKAFMGTRGRDITIEAEDGGDNMGIPGDAGDGGDIILLPGEGGTAYISGEPGRDGNVGIGTRSQGAKLHVDGEITRAYSDGTSNRATPIAYACINSDGTVASGTPNVSCTWNSYNDWYEITISDESYFWQNYMTFVTVSSSQPRFATTSSFDGELLVHIWNTSGIREQEKFQFVTYKP